MRNFCEQVHHDIESTIIFYPNLFKPPHPTLIMQIIGFNFNKISGIKEEELPQGISTNMNVEFLDILKADQSFINNKETLSVKFRYNLDYNKEEKKKPKTHANITLGGTVILGAEKEESKELIQEWKKKKVADQFKIFIFNFILRKCSIKAILLQDELNLPSHIPIPQIRPGQQPQDITKDSKN